MKNKILGIIHVIYKIKKKDIPCKVIKKGDWFILKDNNAKINQEDFFTWLKRSPIDLFMVNYNDESYWKIEGKNTRFNSIKNPFIDNSFF